jgi:hypothetical protein
MKIEKIYNFFMSVRTPANARYRSGSWLRSDSQLRLGVTGGAVGNRSGFAATLI